MPAPLAISLGVFSSEEAAAKVLADVQAKGAKNVQKAPRSSQVTGQVFTVREPDTQLVARFTLLSADMQESTLKATACAAPTSATATNATK